MTIQKQWLRSPLLAALLLVAALLIPMLVVAQTEQGQETIELGISPQVLDLTANPGDSLENEVRLTNGSDGVVEIETIAKNFLPSGEEGAVDLLEDTTSFSLAEWITVFPDRVTMDPGESVDFQVVIDVPQNAEPGGHFGSVVFKTVPPDSDENVASFSQEIAPVILVSVAGDITEGANIASFTSDKSFYGDTDNPVVLETRVENTGNVHFKPTGHITIKNMFGSEVTKINLPEKNVLPESIRRIDAEWSDQGFALGRYTAELSLVYGENSEILNSETSFVIFPYKTVVPAAILIIALVFVLIKFRDRFGKAFRALSGKD